MPSIKITEIDETSAGGLTGSDVVFVVGMATQSMADDDEKSKYLNTPVYFDSLTSFQWMLGDTPYQWSETQAVPSSTMSSVSTTSQTATIDVDETKANVYKFIDEFNATVLNQNNLIVPVASGSKTIIYTVSGTSDLYVQDDQDGPKISLTDFKNKYGIVFTNNFEAEDEITIVITFGSSNDAFSPYSTVISLAEAGDPDKGYVYASELLYLGLPVLYYPIWNTVDPTAQSMSYMYSKLFDIFEEVKDRGEFSPKYLTTGGLPILGYNQNDITTQMLKTAYDRGDSVALIDHTNNSLRELTGDESVYEEVKDYIDGLTDTQKNYAPFSALFTPWASYTTRSLKENINLQMPASFAYCTALAQSIKTNANWFAIAGVARGQAPTIVKDSLATKGILTNTIADEYQPDNDVAINAITNIRPYGLTIWGNRTLKKNDKDGTTATSFLNLRNLVNDVKKTAYTAAKSLMFEQNTDILWINFKSKITPLLDRMTSGQGLSGYKIIKETPTDGDRTKVQAKIILYPVYAVEKFDITVIIRNEDIEVA